MIVVLNLLPASICFQAQFDAGELITQREIVSQKVSEALTERAGQFGLILDDISIVNKHFLKGMKRRLINFSFDYRPI